MKCFGIYTTWYNCAVGVISTLKKIAEENGVKAQAYLAENTPSSLVEKVQKKLGQENVVIFKDPE